MLMTQPTGEDVDLAFLALDHGIDSITPPSGGPLIPFVMIEDAVGNRRLARFMASTLEDSLDQARRTAATESDAARVAIAFDGYITLEGRRTDAIYVELHARNAPTGFMFVQRYETKGMLRKKLDRIGAPGLVGNDLPPLLG